MPRPALLDPDSLDTTILVADREAIMAANPQRHEFMLLDAVVYCDDEDRLYAGYHDVHEDAWWVRGHVPGRPLFPGVLMLESAAQLASYVAHRAFGNDCFVGLTGVDEVKYRGTVCPPARFVVIGKAVELRKRRVRCYTQGFVDGTMVFESQITGMLI
jgi:3-hydroxyacyl-[acyl-carrier-protein] dehydratase